jgi:hypothetical protein
MAASLLLGIKAVFDDKGLKDAQKQFDKLGKGVKTALGAAGIAVGIAAITSALKDSAKAAAEDAKSQALLANGLRNSVGATESQIASVEESIRQMQLQAAVADDQIRPAFDQLARATGDLGEATRLTNIALDISAATGKDLGSVSVALGRAVNGSTTALSRLGINVKGVADPIGLLEQRFQGAAEAAANNDPFQRLQIIFDDLREQVGQYLLPMLNNLATYFSSADFADAFDKLAFSIGKAIEQIDKLFVQLTGENAFTWILDTLSNIIFEVFYFINSLSIIGQIFAKVAEQWLTLDFASMGKTDWAAWAKAEGEKFRDAWNRENKKTNPTNPLDPNGNGDFTGGGGGGGSKAAEDQRTKNLKKALEERKKAIADANKAIQNSIKGNAEAFADMQKAGEESLKAVRDALAMVANELMVAVAKSADMGEFEANVVSAFQSVRTAIADALNNGQIFASAATALNAYADKEQAAFIRIARQRDALAKKIDIARTLSASILQAGNITNLLESQSQTVTESVRRMVDGVELVTTKTTQQVTNGDLVGGFQRLVDKTKAFAKNLVELRKLGLNGNLFKQIVEAGVDAGGATAEAIIAGGGSTIQELNSLYSQLADAGASVAQTATDEFFALGENVTNSFIDGLLSQESQLASAAEALAKSFNSVFSANMLAAVGVKNTADQRALIESQIAGVDAALTQARSELSAMGKVSAVASPQRYGVASGLNATIRALTSQKAGLESQLGSFNTMNPTASVQPVVNNITVQVDAGIIANKAELPGQIVDALGTYVRQSGSAALTRILAV